MELTALAGAAYRSVPGTEATPEIYAERGALIARYGEGYVYEILVRPGEDVRALYLRDASRLVYYLTSRRYGSLGDPRLVVALFLGETLYFLDSSDFLFGLIAAFELEPQALGEAVRGWARGEFDRIGPPGH